MKPVSRGDRDFPRQSHASLRSSPGSMGSAGAREDTEEPEEDRVRIKSKLVSAWNTVKYGWSLKSKPRFNKKSPVVLLGQTFSLTDAGEREAFRQCFTTLLWMTYRTGFPVLSGSTLSSDCGWGCMLRSAQMLLAQALVLHLIPPGWTWSASQHGTQDDLDVRATRLFFSAYRGTSDCPRARRKSVACSLLSIGGCGTEATHRLIVSWFVDHPQSPFGLHRMVEMGKGLGKQAGDWYGPGIASHIIRRQYIKNDLVYCPPLRKAVAASELSDVVVYVAQDCTVYKGDIVKLCERPRYEGPRARPAPWRALVLLVPVRLGGDAINPAYVDSVKRLFRLESCIGIIGGRPKHSLYFVGFQDEHLLYLDPHYSRATVDISQDDFPLESFHCKSARKMAFSRMDPSCAVGFYARGQREFETLCLQVSAALNSDKNKYPMFTFVEGHQEDGESDTSSSFFSESSCSISRGRPSKASQSSSADEFVFL